MTTDNIYDRLAEQVSLYGASAVKFYASSNLLYYIQSPEGEWTYPVVDMVTELAPDAVVGGDVVALLLQDPWLMLAIRARVSVAFETGHFIHRYRQQWPETASVN